jgi:hypothetical protein
MVFVTLAPVIFNELFLPQLLRFASKQSTNWHFMQKWVKIQPKVILPINELSAYDSHL